MYWHKIIVVLSIVLSLTGCNRTQINEYELLIETQNNSIDRQMMSLKEQRAEIQELSLMVDELTTTEQELLLKNIELEEQLNALKDTLNVKEESIHPIELKFNEEMESWNGNTGDGVNIIMTYVDLWKVEIESYYDLLRAELDEESQEVLMKSQEEWLAHTETNIKLSSRVYNQQIQGGSIMQILNADEYYSRYKDRAEELIYWYEFITGG